MLCMFLYQFHCHITLNSATGHKNYKKQALLSLLSSIFIFSCRLRDQIPVKWEMYTSLTALKGTFFACQSVNWATPFNYITHDMASNYMSCDGREKFWWCFFAVLLTVHVWCYVLCKSSTLKISTRICIYWCSIKGFLKEMILINKAEGHIA